MAKEKSLVEDAITQIKGLEDVLAENAKGILRSTMKEEISDLVKESLTEEDDEIEMEFDTEELEDEGSEDSEGDDDNEEFEKELSLDIDDLGLGIDMDVDDEDEETIDLTDIDDEEELLRVFSLMGPEDNIVVTQDDAGNINLKDEEKEYMIVGEGEEEFEIELEEELDFDEDIEEVSEGDEEVHEEDTDDDESFDEESIEDIVSRVFESSYGEDNESEDIEEVYEEDEIMYEIEFDEEEEDDEFIEVDLEETLEESKPSFKYGSKPNSKGFNTKMKKVNPKKGTGKPKFEFKEGQGYDDHEDERLGMEDGKISKKDFRGSKKRKSKSRRDDAHFETESVGKEETKEASRTLGNGKYWGRKGLNKPKAAPRNIRVENTNTKELQVLREKNEEYRKALNVFRNKLNEVAVFNSNLAYSTRLFTEHSTSKSEKINILRRFDNVDTIKESKGLYKTIKNELSSNNGSSKTMNESIGNTIDKNLSTGSSQNLIESKTYENPQFLRMKDLMSKL